MTLPLSVWIGDNWGKEEKKIILGAGNAISGYAQTNCHFWAF